MYRKIYFMLLVIQCMIISACNAQLRLPNNALTFTSSLAATHGLNTIYKTTLDCLVYYYISSNVYDFAVKSTLSFFSNGIDTSDIPYEALAALAILSFRNLAPKLISFLQL